MALENLKSLKDDMVKKKWTICSFLFEYKRNEYIVLVKRFVGEEKRVDKYALVKLHFLRSDDLNNDLEVEANSLKLLMDVKDLRKYFGIEYSDNIGDIMKQFTDELGVRVPEFVPDEITPKEQTAMVQSLSKSDSEDPDKIYCTKVKRNANGGTRSEFNEDKTKLLRKELFQHFSNHNGISFCYSKEKSKENTDAVILRNFAANNS